MQKRTVQSRVIERNLITTTKTQSHFHTWKSGKRWLYASSTLIVLAGAALSTRNVQAAETDSSSIAISSMGTSPTTVSSNANDSSITSSSSTSNSSVAMSSNTATSSVSSVTSNATLEASTGSSANTTSDSSVSRSTSSFDLSSAILSSSTSSSVTSSTETSPENGWDITNTYYYRSGEKLIGQNVIDGHWYLFDKTTGAKKIGFQNLVNYGKNKTVYYNGQGQMLYNQQYLNGHWYLFANVIGAQQIGRKYISNQTKWVLYNRQLGANGYMLYGQQGDQGNWYLFQSSTGAMQYGLQNLSSYGQNKVVWYNMTSGIMAHGWTNVNGIKLFFNTITGALGVAPHYFSQLDPRWANVWIGNSTFGASGCVMTAIAMVAAGYGINITPLQAGYTGYNISGYNHSYAGGSQTDLIKVAAYYGLKTRVLSSTAVIAQQLAAGLIVTLAVNIPGGTHEIVLSGYSNGNTKVLDPYNNLFYSGWTNLNGLWNNRSSDPIDSNAGAQATLVYF